MKIKKELEEIEYLVLLASALQDENMILKRKILELDKFAMLKLEWPSGISDLHKEAKESLRRSRTYTTLAPSPLEAM